MPLDQIPVTERRLAVIVVHGVAAERPMAAAEAVAEMLASFRANDAEYTNVSREARRIEVKNIYGGSSTAEAESAPPAGEEFDPSTDWVTKSRNKAASFDVPEGDQNFRTFCLTTFRIPHTGGKPAIQVDFFESYWGDITRATKYSVLKSLVALYLLLFDLGLLARQALKEAQHLTKWDERSDSIAEKGRGRVLRLALKGVAILQGGVDHIVRNWVPVLNLVIAACALGALTTALEEKAARLIMSAIMGSLAGLGVWLASPWVRSWFARIGSVLLVSVIVSVCVYGGVGLRSPLQGQVYSINVAFFCLLALLGIGTLGWRSTRTEFKVAAWVCGGATALIVVSLALISLSPAGFLNWVTESKTALTGITDRERAQIAMAVPAIIAYVGLSLLWVLANGFLGAFIMLGLGALSLAQKRCRRAILTALGTQLCGTALVMLTTVSLWHLALIWLDFVGPSATITRFKRLFEFPPGTWDGAQVSLLQVCHGLLERCYNPMTFWGIQAGVVFFVAVFLASLPFIHRELNPKPWDGKQESQASRSKESETLGSATTDGLRLSFWSILFFMFPVFGVLVWGGLYSNWPPLKDTLNGFLAVDSDPNSFYIPGLLPALAIGFGLLVAFFLKPALAVTVDVINWFRERPKNQTVWQRCTARFFAVLEYVSSGKANYDGKHYDGVIVVAHSQGTMISVETLKLIRLQPPPQFHAPPLWLLTMGSPLRQLYCERFPGRYGWVETNANSPENDLGVEQWINLYGAADYVGRNLWNGDNHPYAVGPHPVSGGIDRLDVCLGETAHTQYWSLRSRAVAEQLDKAITALAGR